MIHNTAHANCLFIKEKKNDPKSAFLPSWLFSLSESRKGKNNDFCQLQAGRDWEGGALTLVMQQEFTGHASHDNQTAVA